MRVSSSNISKRLGDERCVSAGGLKARLQIGRRFLRGSKVFGNIVAGRSGFFHSKSLFKVSCEAQGDLDVARLRMFVAAREKNDQLSPTSRFAP